jgi:hypothetical protein
LNLKVKIKKIEIIDEIPNLYTKKVIGSNPPSVNLITGEATPQMTVTKLDAYSGRIHD